MTHNPNYAAPQSLALQNRAKKRIPGLAQLLSKRPDMFAPDVWPGYYTKAKGTAIWDMDDNRYTDMSIGGIGANVLGYADDDVDNAVIEAIRAGSSSSLNCAEEVELADLLCALHPWAEKARFARCGGEAMAVAVRIARAHTGRDKVAFCGYHGWHDWYLAANLADDAALDGHLIPGLAPTGVPRALAGTAFPFAYNKLGALKEIVAKHGKDLGAIVMEPIRSEQPTKEFIEGVRSIADETGAVLIVDEISAGFRFHTGGAHLKVGLKPDMAVFSKSLGNGYPIAAIIGIGDVMDSAQASFISSTMWTERVGPVAALATLKKHKEKNVGPHLMKMWGIIRKGWAEKAAKHGLHLHIAGELPMGHFGFEDGDGQAMKTLFIQKMLEHGFLASNLFYAMYAHNEKICADYLAAVDTVFGEMAALLAQDGIEKALKSAPATTGFKRLA